MAFMGLDNENVEKLRSLAKLGSMITVVWSEREPHYSETWNSFCFFCLLDPQKFPGKPDCGGITFKSKYKFLIFLEIVNGIGTHVTFQVKNSYNTEKREEICWHISPAVLLTALQLLEQNPSHLEKCAKNASDEETFIALTALRDA